MVLRPPIFAALPVMHVQGHFPPLAARAPRISPKEKCADGPFSSSQCHGSGCPQGRKVAGA
ncbi:hypothetical protein CUJ84_Chr003997 [Rhizobium leguminosarum]|uniref:Uncharacterized protein n=1 Tax=Rhizobium leguminosarum TaxID=384 RepID=A0A2K9Z809_RHILE|nr:hypothetical protein CUJ84_Chr003997 [Rhizobium leguminosarum]